MRSCKYHGPVPQLVKLLRMLLSFITPKDKACVINIASWTMNTVKHSTHSTSKLIEICIYDAVFYMFSIFSFRVVGLTVIFYSQVRFTLSFYFYTFDTFLVYIKLWVNKTYTNLIVQSSSNVYGSLLNYLRQFVCLDCSQCFAVYFLNIIKIVSIVCHKWCLKISSVLNLNIFKLLSSEELL